MIAPDFLGCGDEPPWPSDAAFDLSMDVDRVAALVDAVAPVHLVGCSYGGAVTVTAAARHASRVASLFLVDPVLPVPGRWN